MRLSRSRSPHSTRSSRSLRHSSRSPRHSLRSPHRSRGYSPSSSRGHNSQSSRGHNSRRRETHNNRAHGDMHGKGKIITQHNPKNTDVATTSTAVDDDDSSLSLMDRLGRLSERQLRATNAIKLPTADDFFFAAEKEVYYRNMYKLIVTARQEIQTLEEKLQAANKKFEARCVVACPSCSFKFSTEPNRLLPKYVRVLRSTNRVELQFDDMHHLREWLTINELDRDRQGIPTFFFDKENNPNHKNANGDGHLKLSNVGSTIPLLKRQCVAATESVREKRVEEF